jgi:hypothetical protein
MPALCSECGSEVVNKALYVCPVCGWMLCAIECIMSQMARGHHVECCEKFCIEHGDAPQPPPTFVTIKLVDSWLCL